MKTERTVGGKGLARQPRMMAVTTPINVANASVTGRIWSLSMVKRRVHILTRVHVAVRQAGRPGMGLREEATASWPAWLAPRAHPTTRIQYSGVRMNLD